ncbi:MAG TPA: hypothetical protein VK898_22360, partial [Chloroflexota bacterium]|nr:hypothetical protein [Chloroflexota bacterium]
MSRDSAARNEVEEIWRSIRARHPSLRAAVAADAVTFARYRGERHEFRSRLELARYAIRLAWTSDAFLALALYRLKAMLQRRRVPFLPTLAHRLAIVLGQVSIGDPVVVEGGVYLPHGQVVVDGIVEIGAGTVLTPFVTIGLIAGNFNGPVLERDVQVGTGAKILGPVRVGAGATVGAGAVVVDDVPAGATVTGVPARQLRGAGYSAKQNGELPNIEQLREEIVELTQAEAAPVSAKRAQRLLYVRHLAGIHLLRGANGAEFAQPNGVLTQAERLPEFSSADLTPGLLRAGILRDGCVLVRGLIPREAALVFASD